MLLTNGKVSWVTPKYFGSPPEMKNTNAMHEKKKFEKDYVFTFPFNLLILFSGYVKCNCKDLNTFFIYLLYENCK